MNYFVGLRALGIPFDLVYESFVITIRSLSLKKEKKENQEINFA